MGKRNLDSETHFETPVNKKRKTENVIDVLQSVPEISYSLSADVVDGVILTDLCAKQWRCGKPIGKQTKSSHERSENLQNSFVQCRQGKFWRNLSRIG